MQKFKEKKKKDFCRISKIFSAKKLYICQLYLNIIQDKFSSTAPTHKCSNYKNFWWQRYKLQKLMMAKNTPRLQKIVFLFWKKTDVVKWPFLCKIQARNKNVSTFFSRFYYFLCNWIQYYWQLQFLKAYLCFKLFIL